MRAPRLFCRRGAPAVIFSRRIFLAVIDGCPKA
jgi:hypothetical protein